MLQIWKRLQYESTETTFAHLRKDCEWDHGVRSHRGDKWLQKRFVGFGVGTAIGRNSLSSYSRKINPSRFRCDDSLWHNLESLVWFQRSLCIFGTHDHKPVP